ncbi:MAG: hypothetical protein WC947_10780 [Elusimicrobiota bacterium]
MKKLNLLVAICLISVVNMKRIRTIPILMMSERFCKDFAKTLQKLCNLVLYF